MTLKRRRDEKNRSKNFSRDEKGVSEVVSNILTLAITVTLFTSVFAMVMQTEAPEKDIKVDFVSEYEYTDDTHYLNITHGGGDSLEFNSIDDTFAFNFIIDSQDTVYEYEASKEEGEIEHNGQGDVWNIGEEMRISIPHGELTSDGVELNETTSLRFTVQNYDLNQRIYDTVLVDEQEEQVLSIHNPRLENEHYWRTYSFPNEEVNIRAELNTPFYLRWDDFDLEDEDVVENVTFKATTIQEGVLRDEDGNDISENAVELNHNGENGFESEDLTIITDIYTSYSVKLEAQYERDEFEIEAEPTYLSLDIGEEKERRYQANLVIGDVRYDPEVPSHGQNVEIEADVFNQGAVNYTTSWEIFDDGERVYPEEGETEEINFKTGPDPTTLEGEFPIYGVEEHEIEVKVNPTLEDNRGRLIEDEDPESNSWRFDLNVDPSVLVVRDRTADETDDHQMVTNALPGLNLDYGIHEVEEEDFPTHIDEYSMAIWLTGDREDEAPLLNNTDTQDDILEYMLDYNGRFWVMGSNLNTVDFQKGVREGYNLRHMMGLSDDIDSPVEAEGELLNNADPHMNHTYGRFPEYQAHPGMNAHNLIGVSEAEDENKLLMDEDKLIGHGYEHSVNNRSAINTHLLSNITDPVHRANMVQEVVNWLANISLRTGQDVAVSSQRLEPEAPMFMDEISVNATLRNNGPENISVPIRLLRNGQIEEDVDEKTVEIEKFGGTKEVTLNWTADELGEHELLVVADAFEEIDQVNRENTDITYKNLEITEDVVETNVHYSTLLVDSENEEGIVSEKVNESMERVGQRFGDTYDYHEVEEDNIVSSEKMATYNSIMWVTGEREDAFYDDEIGELHEYLNDEEEGNILFVGENILSTLDDEDDYEEEADEIMQHMGIDPDSEISSVETPSRLIGDKESDFGRSLRYELEDGADIDVFDDYYEDHGEKIFLEDESYNLASTYDDGERMKNIFLGVNPTRFAGPHILEEHQDYYDEWPGGNIDMRSERAIDEFIYTALWYFGYQDDRVDLRATDYDIEISDENPETGRSYEITAEIENYGYGETSPMVRLKDGEESEGTQTPRVGSSEQESEEGIYVDVSSETEIVEYTWEPDFAGDRYLRIKIDPLRGVDEFGIDGEESSDEKLFEFNNQAIIENPVYFFYDDMEDGPDRWSHDANLMNVDGYSVFDFIGRDEENLDTDVVGSWDWDKSGSTSDGDVEYGEEVGVYRTDDEEIEHITGGSSYSPPRSYWMPESGGGDGMSNTHISEQTDGNSNAELMQTTETIFYDDVSEDKGYETWTSMGYASDWGIRDHGSVVGDQSWDWGDGEFNKHEQHGMESRLTSPEIEIPDDAENVELTFQHWRDFGDTSLYDGGNLRISVDDGDFELVEPEEGYDGTIETDWDNPLGGEQGWGEDHGWETATFDLTEELGEDIDGSTIQLRWNAGTEAWDGFEGEGWRIDDITVEADISYQQYPYPDKDAPHTLPGRIQAENFDQVLDENDEPQLGQGISYYDTSEENEGGAYRDDQYVDIEECDDDIGEYNVGWIRDDEWIEYTVDVHATDIYDLELRVAANSEVGTLRILFDGDDKTGEVDLPVTGGWQNWETVTLEDIELDEGEQQMRIEMISGDFNLNWVRFFDSGPLPPTDPYPEDGATDVATDVDLNVFAEHEEGESMDVTFYDASDDESIGTDYNVDSGSYAEVTWSDLEQDTDYEWYAVAEDDDGNTAESDTWKFTTAEEVVSPVEHKDYRFLTTESFRIGAALLNFRPYSGDDDLGDVRIDYEAERWWLTPGSGSGGNVEERDGTMIEIEDGDGTVEDGYLHENPVAILRKPEHLIGEGLWQPTVYQQEARGDGSGVIIAEHERILNMEPVSGAAEDFVLIWEDLHNQHPPGQGPDGDGDHWVRVTELEDGRYRIHVFRAEGGFIHEFYIGDEHMYTKPGGESWENEENGVWDEILEEDHDGQLPAFEVAAQAESLHFEHKYAMDQSSSGGMMYLWGSDDDDPESWEWNKSSRLYIDPRAHYPGTIDESYLEEESEQGGPMDNTGLKDATGELPRHVFNGKSERRFEWTSEDVDLQRQIEENIGDFDFRHFRVVFLTASFDEEITENDRWNEDRGWYIDNVNLQITGSWYHDDIHWTHTSADELIDSDNDGDTDDMQLDPDRDDVDEENYYDQTRGDDQGHFWMFGDIEDGRDVLPQGVDQSLYTEPIYLTNAENPILTSHLKFNIDDGEGSPPDGFRVEISTDDGHSWDSLTQGARSAWNYSGSGCEYSGGDGDYGWVDSHELGRLDVDLSGWAEERVILRFRVVTNTDEDDDSTYDDPDKPRAIFLDDVWVTEGRIDVEQETSTNMNSVDNDSIRKAQESPRTESSGVSRKQADMDESLFETSDQVYRNVDNTNDFNPSISEDFQTKILSTEEKERRSLPIMDRKNLSYYF